MKPKSKLKGTTRAIPTGESRYFLSKAVRREAARRELEKARSASLSFNSNDSNNKDSNEQL